jgi:hypothetical protein
MGESIVDRTRLRLTLMFFKVGLELLSGFFAVEHKFLPGSEGQAAEVAVGDARSCPDESYNLQIPFWHASIVSNSDLKASSRNLSQRPFFSKPKAVTFVVVPT